MAAIGSVTNHPLGLLGGGQGCDCSCSISISLKYKSSRLRTILLEIRDLLSVFVLSACVVCYIHVFLISWSLGAIEGQMVLPSQVKTANCCP